MQYIEGSDQHPEMDAVVADVKRKVRIVIFDDCPWYVGTDVCKVLGLTPSPSNKSYQSQFKRLTPYDMTTLPENLGGQGHKRVLISASGLRKLAAHSLLRTNARAQLDRQGSRLLPEHYQEMQRW